MKIIASLDTAPHPPMLKLSVHDAPHRRMHHKVIQQYREFLVAACMRAGIAMPIEDVIDLNVIFVNPASPDNDNLLTALYQAMDGKTLKGPSVLVDDSLIDAVHIRKLWPQGKKK